MAFEEDLDISYLKTRESKYDFIKEYVNNKIKILHHTENMIYKLYSDGRVTKVNDTDIMYEMYEIIKPNTFFTFPCKGENEGDTYGILIYDDCVKIRNIMDILLLQV